jgi:hypothetical protein
MVLPTASLTSLPSRSIVFLSGGGISMPAVFFKYPADFLKDFPGAFAGRPGRFQFVEQILNCFRVSASIICSIEHVRRHDDLPMKNETFSHNLRLVGDGIISKQ